MIQTKPRGISPRAGLPPLVAVTNGSAKRTLGAAKAAGATTFTLSAAPGWTASAAMPLSLTLIQQSTYGDPATEVATEYYVTAISGAVCTIGGVLSGTDRAYAAGDFCESRVSSAAVNGAAGVLAYGGSTAGQVLTSTGAGTPPTWQAATGGGGTGSGTVVAGTAGQLAYYPAAGASVSGLAVGSNLAISGGALNATAPGGSGPAPAGVLAGGTPVSNTTAVTDLAAGATALMGGTTLGGGRATAGSVIRVRAAGIYTGNGTIGLGLRVYLGGSGGTGILYPAPGGPMSPANTGAPWSLDAILVVRQAGASGSIAGWGQVRMGGTSTAPAEQIYSLRNPTAGTPVTVDLTAAQEVTVAASWAAANAAVSLAMTDFAWWFDALASSLQGVVADGTAVTNTTTVTDLGTAAVTIAGSPAVAAGTLRAGSVLTIRAAGIYTGNAAANLGLRVYLGGTTGTAILYPAPGALQAANVAGAPWMLEATLVVRQAGASGSIAGWGQVRMAGTQAAPTEQVYSIRNPTAGTAVTVDTTAALAVTVAASWSAASAAVSIQMKELAWWLD